MATSLYSPQTLDCGHNKTDRTFWVVHNQLRIQPENMEAGAFERQVPPCVTGDASAVIAAINFHDEADGRSEQISDEPAQRHLSAEPHTKLSAAHELEERSFRGGGSAAHVRSARLDQLSAVIRDSKFAETH